MTPDAIRNRRHRAKNAWPSAAECDDCAKTKFIRDFGPILQRPIGGDVRRFDDSWLGGQPRRSARSQESHTSSSPRKRHEFLGPVVHRGEAHQLRRPSTDATRRRERCANSRTHSIERELKDFLRLVGREEERGQFREFRSARGPDSVVSAGVRKRSLVCADEPGSRRQYGGSPAQRQMFRKLSGRTESQSVQLPVNGRTASFSAICPTYPIIGVHRRWRHRGRSMAGHLRFGGYPLEARRSQRRRSARVCSTLVHIRMTPPPA